MNHCLRCGRELSSSRKEDRWDLCEPCVENILELDAEEVYEALEVIRLEEENKC